jgi:hypothetical protein
MKVFEVLHESNKYKTLLFEQGINELKHPLLRFDGSSIVDEWRPPAVWCQYPKKKQGDFWGIGSCCVPAVTCTAFPTVQSHIEAAGEALSLQFEGVELLIVNVTEVINCLDQDKVQWRDNGDGTRRFNIDAGYHFLPGRFSESSLFRLPETSRSSRFYCVERSGDPEEDFKAAVEAAKLTGLKFKQIWEA